MTKKYIGETKRHVNVRRLLKTPSGITDAT